MITKEQAVKIWKDNNLTTLVFYFACGGDEMYDFNFDKELNDEELNDEDLKAYLNNDIFEKVKFYEVTDNYYLGEAGTVTIKLNESQDDFCYFKESESEYQDEICDNIEIALDSGDITYIKLNILKVKKESDSQLEFDFKDNYVKTDENNIREERIKKAITTAITDYIPDPDLYSGELLDTDCYLIDSNIDCMEKSIIITANFRYLYFDSFEE
jgi:hypothetical protein